MGALVSLDQLALGVLPVIPDSQVRKVRREIHQLLNHNEDLEDQKETPVVQASPACPVILAEMQDRANPAYLGLVVPQGLRVTQDPQGGMVMWVNQACLVYLV